jgi:hypothetical protein
MRSSRMIAVAALISSAAALPVAEAHHSYPALFFPEKTVAVSGEVVRFQFQAPHCYIFVKATGEGGVAEDWELETTSPGQLIRKGVTPETLHAGDKISAVGNPARDGRNLMRLLTITMPDGEEKQIQ